jgi:hypothetical protein
MKICLSKVDENLSTTLARNKLPVVAPEAVVLLHARTHARRQGPRVLMRTRVNLRFLESSFFIKNLWINADLIFKEASVKRLFFRFCFFFLGWQFCVVAKVAILDPLQDLARFGYKLNIKVMCYKSIQLYFWLQPT